MLAHSEKKRKETPVQNEPMHDWSEDQILEMIQKNKETDAENWLEKGLPRLVDKIVRNYQEYGNIQHFEGKDLPSKHTVVGILEDLMTILFPGYMGEAEIARSNTRYFVGNALHSIYDRLVEEVDKSLKYVCRRVKECPEDICLNMAHTVAGELLERIPQIRILLRGDIQAAYDGDPAAKSIDEVILSYPCVLAIATYRIAHELHIRGVPLVPRIMAEYAHSRTGIDIHPGARIGRNFFIDHGTGVVIGESAKIGDDVKVYQGVTLGALSFPRDEEGRLIKGKKRHPTVGNNVIIYSGATILGGDTEVGDNAVIGGNVWITSSIPAGTQVAIVPPELRFKEVETAKDSESGSVN